MDEKIGFGVVDYCVFVGMLVISAVIGLFISYKGSKSPEEFLMGNRSLKPFPVFMSLLTTYISAAGLLGYTGEIYGNGLQISTSILSCPLAIIISSQLILPILYPLKLISINEYIEVRFKSKQLRFTIFLLTMVRTLAYSGMCLYAPTIALSSVTKLSTLANIFILGVICTIYSSFGGVKAVIWTDVFQFSVMLIGTTAVVIVGCAQNGGFINTMHIASEGGRLEAFDMNPSPFVRHTFFNTFANGFFSYLLMYNVNQIYIQRISSVKSIKTARSVLKYNMYGQLFMYLLIFSCGLVAYATYAGCNPMALGIIKKKEQIMPYFIMDKLGFIPGFPGLYFATLIAGSLSTLSSYMNASVALLWKDVCQNFTFFKDMSSINATLTNKILSLSVGAVLIGVAILVSNARGLTEMILTICGTLSGPMLGVFLIGFFLPQCNLKGVWTGFIGSSVLTLWLSLGAMLYKEPTKMLAFSAADCLSSNISSVNMTSFQETTSTTYINIDEIIADTSNTVSPYQISYTLYIVIGPVSCIILSVILSCLTGNQKRDDVSPRHVCHYVHKFYWTKEELEAIRRNDVNLHRIISKQENNEAEN
ncbi:UNVERIFIED_CONTAM: hypothetical protein RMT77_003568 [Armadillidium vulgare]